MKPKVKMRVKLYKRGSVKAKRVEAIIAREFEKMLHKEPYKSAWEKAESEMLEALKQHIMFGKPL